LLIVLQYKIGWLCFSGCSHVFQVITFLVECEEFLFVVFCFLSYVVVQTKFVDLVFVLPYGSGRYYRAALYSQERTLVPFEYEVVWALEPVWMFFGEEETPFLVI